MSRAKEVQSLGTVLQLHRPAQGSGSSSMVVHRPALPARVPSFTPELLQAIALPVSVQQAALLICEPDQPAARQMATDDLIEQLLEPLQVVPFLLGHRKTLLDPKELAVLATAVAEMVQRDFPALKVSEICAAFRRGCAGEWQKPGQIPLCSLPCLTGWLRSYCLTSRAPAVQALQSAQARQLQLSSPVPVINYPQEVAELAAWVSDHATPEHPAGRFPEPFDQGNLLYDWLLKIGAFAGLKSPRQYERIWRKECLIRMAQPPTGLDGYRLSRRFKDHLRAGEWHPKHPFCSEVATACRRRLFKEWIFHHLGNGTDLQPYLSRLQASAKAKEAA